jgi:hypothetical protein
MSVIPDERVQHADGTRALAFVGLIALTGAYTSVLWRVTDVVGGSTEFAVVVAASLALAAVVGRYVGVRVALGTQSRGGRGGWTGSAGAR